MGKLWVGWAPDRLFHQNRKEMFFRAAAARTTKARFLHLCESHSFPSGTHVVEFPASPPGYQYICPTKRHTVVRGAHPDSGIAVDYLHCPEKTTTQHTFQPIFHAMTGPDNPYERFAVDDWCVK